MNRLAGTIFWGLIALHATLFAQMPALQEPEDFSSSSTVLLIASPIDLGAVNEYKKNLWLRALLDAAAHFRFDYCTSFKSVPAEVLARHVSPVLSGKTNSVQDYSGIMGEVHATHQLLQKFEVDNKNRNASIIMEIADVASGRTVTSVETRCGFDFLGKVIDSCFFVMAKGVSGNNLSPEEIRFFSQKALCDDFQNIKKTGDLVLIESYSGIASPRATGEDYATILAVEKKPLLCSWRLGQARYREGNYTAALSHFRTMYNLFPDNEACGLAIAKTCIGNKDPQTAKYQLNTIVTTRPDPLPGVYRILGDSYLLTADTAAALDYYRKERSLHENTALLQEKIASTCFAEKAFIDAETEYASLILLDEKNPRARYYLAYIKFKLGRSGEADILLVDAEKYGKGTTYLWEAIGDCYAAGNEPDKAVSAYKKAYALNGKSTRMVNKPPRSIYAQVTTAWRRNIS
jgi:tetratricopeptide (TPR) repeat protein